MEEILTTNQKGTLTEMRCRLFFLEHGITCSVPETPARYDFIIDANDELLKIQVKTCRNDGEALTFATCSHHNTGKGNQKQNYQNDNIDYFCTWADNECYLVPVSECGKNEKRLRLIPTKNGQTKNISFAKNYLAMEVLKSR